MWHVFGRRAVGVATKRLMALDMGRAGVNFRQRIPGHVLQNVNEEIRNKQVTKLSSMAMAVTIEEEVVQPGMESSGFQPKLVIFDKDGTLIDFNAMWIAWVVDLGERLHAKGLIRNDEESLHAFFHALGYDHRNGKVATTSPLCCSPMHLIQGICVEWIEKHNEFSRDEAILHIQSVWAMPDPTKTAKPLTDLKDLFKYLKEDLEIKIAVCTTDDRGVTLETLKHLGVAEMVDILLAGDDRHVEPKPSPNQIKHICDSLNVSITDSIMVGDTVTDMKMGRAANVGLNIGVMHGASSLEDLSLHSDFLVPTMNNFSKIISRIAKTNNKKKSKM